MRQRATVPTPPEAAARAADGAHADGAPVAGAHADIAHADIAQADAAHADGVHPDGVHVVALPGYDITIATGALDRVGAFVRRAAPAHRYALLSDDTVAPLYARRVLASLGGAALGPFTMPAGERFKTRATWAALTDALLAAGAGRDTTLIALGGGVVGDVAGFVAATYLRGVPYVQVPTTLLAMIDASIGGKTGVDTPAGKNLVGAFHPPSAVVVDPAALATLPLPERRGGLAEALKHGIVADAAYLEATVAALPRLLAEPLGDAAWPLIVRSIEIKADIVRRDLREGSVRKVLNFGHTLGHALEQASGYALTHGEAVAIGMVLESALAERMGVAEPGTAARVREAVTAAGLPAVVPRGISAEQVLRATRTDKKARGGEVAYALPRCIGAMAGEGSGWAVRVAEALVLEVLA